MEVLKIILVPLLSLGLLGCGNGFLDGGNNGSNSDPANRVTGEVCYFSDSFCLPQLDITSLNDPKGDYDYPKSNNGPQYRTPSYVVDLRDQNLNKKIAKNFKAIDFMSEAKGPYGIISRVLIDAIQSVRDEWRKPIFVTSGFRSPGYNRKISGAAQFSRHTYGDAIDFQSSDNDFEELQELCEKYGAGFTLVYETHIHCDWRLSPLDEGFYPPVLSPARIKQLAYHEITKGHIEWQAQGELISIYVADFFAEEPGNFRYEWLIETPSGQLITSRESSIHLKPEAGDYKISVLVGNSVQMNETLRW